MKPLPLVLSMLCLALPITVVAGPTLHDRGNRPKTLDTKSWNEDSKNEESHGSRGNVDEEAGKYHNEETFSEAGDAPKDE